MLFLGTRPLLPHCILTTALEGRKGSSLMIIWEREGQWRSEVTPPSRGVPFLPAALAVQWAGGGRRLKSLQGTFCFSVSPGSCGVPWVSKRYSFFFSLFYQNWQLACRNWASATSQVLRANKMKCPELGGFLLVRSLLYLGLIFMMSQSSLGGCNTLCLGL